MASGFMSSVARRLFHGKGKNKSPRPETTAGRSTASSQDYLPSPSSSSSSPTTSSVAQKQNKWKGQENKPRSDTPVKKRQHGKGKSPLFSSLRKKTRPLSCIASRSDSPPTVSLTDPPLKGQADARTPTQRGKSIREDGEKSSSQQRREKPRRPLSCIVKPPSPRLLPSMDNSPELCPRNADREAASDRKEEDSHPAAHPKPRPRPVSCFVEAPTGRSPPPYFRRPQGGSPQICESGDQYAPFHVGSPQRSPPCYLEAARRSPKLSPLSQQPLSQQTLSQQTLSQQPLPLDGRSPGRPLPYQAESSQPRYAEKNTSLTYYPEYVQEPMPAYPDSPQQPTPYPVQSPRQSTPVMDNRQFPESSGRCGNANCFLDPCPYRYVSAQPQGFSGYSYDLKTYFPPAPSARRYARPQSACFLCEPQPCCVEARRTCRPKSQCYFAADCNVPWSEPNPPSWSMEHQVPQTTPEASSEGDRVLQAEESVSTPQPSTLAVAEAEISDQKFSSVESPHPPLRPAKRTLAPRPKSSYLASTESDGSPMSSPTPSPRIRRFPLKKYRSADCLDRVDELESLDVSPPPAKPLSHFTDTDTNPQQTASSKANDEIFTSAEMLEKLGQPRSRGHHPRPVSCFVGSSADESGYMSTATLGGSGWLGGLSASTGDILEMLQDGDEVNVADDEMSFERASSFRKAWSVCSLLRQDSIQDRSFTVMRQRRQKMKDRRHTNQRSSSTETDEGVGEKEGASTSSLLEAEEGKESDAVAGIPLDMKLRAHRSRGTVMRLHSAHMKAWQIRLRRKQMMKKRRSTERLGSRIETLV